MCQINGESEPFIRNVFTLKNCAPIVGTKVFSFKDEADLLFAWREFVRVLDPDIITGYNIINFDIPYIIGRAEALKIPEFAKLGRVRSIFTKVKDSTFTSKAMGTRETKDINLEGRIQFDML
jgi:DNA polymerase delta subunit 1